MHQWMKVHLDNPLDVSQRTVAVVSVGDTSSRRYQMIMPPGDGQALRLLFSDAGVLPRSVVGERCQIMIGYGSTLQVVSGVVQAREFTPVLRADWKIEPFPEQTVALPYERRFTERQMRRVRLGIMPVEMEDKWVAVFEDDWFYLHRSWTGHGIFKARIEHEAAGDGWRVAEVWYEQAGYSNFGGLPAAVRVLDDLIQNLRLEADWVAE